MNAESYLINKYVSLPENLQQEVMDFIDFLVAKYQKVKQVDETDREGMGKRGQAKNNQPLHLPFPAEKHIRVRRHFVPPFVRITRTHSLISLFPSILH